jgi:uncharacterized protein (DUF488 family)
MTNIYTIGFAQKNAEVFFKLLRNSNVRTLIDVRLNNISQFAGFTKKNDLIFFLKEIGNIKYKHIPELAPTKEILDAYKKKKISWEQYEAQYNELIQSRNVNKMISFEELDDACLLCSEPKADKCHRRLAVEFLKATHPNLKIWHL